MRRLAIVLMSVLVLSGCAQLDLPTIEFPEIDVGPVTGTPAPGDGTDGDGATGDGATGDAAAALATLPVKGRAPKTGYDRGEFGQRWADVDRDGCDQRNQVLARDLNDVGFRPGTRDCVVLSGALLDPYTGEGVPFLRGERTSADVQIDHVVALSNAWQTGAQQLTEDDRELLANDPLNLLAVDGPTNGSKGDGDAATWLPPARGYWCEFVARQVAVKAKYRLWVTPPEAETIGTILDGCPGQPLPPDTGIAVAATS